MPRGQSKEPPRKNAPASPLQAARLARGWSQEDVVNRIRAVCPGHGNSPCRMAANKLSEFETDKRHPTLRHVEVLCRVFEMGPEGLGLIMWPASQ